MNWNNSTVLFLKFKKYHTIECKKCSEIKTLTHSCGFKRYIYNYNSLYSSWIEGDNYTSEIEFINHFKNLKVKGININVNTSQFCNCTGCGYLNNPCNSALSQFYQQKVKSHKESCLACYQKSQMNLCRNCLPGYYRAVVCHIPNKYLGNTNIEDTVYIITIFDVSSDEYAILEKLSFGKNVNWLFHNKEIKFQTSIYSTLNLYDEMEKNNSEYILKELKGYVNLYNPKFNGYAREQLYYDNLVNILNKNIITLEIEQKPNPHISEKKRKK